MKNTQWRLVYGSLIAAVVFGVLSFGALTYINGFSGGYALAFLAILLSVSSLGTAALFFQRARAIDDVLSGKQVLAHWVYTRDDAEKSVEREYVSYLGANRALFIVVGVIIVLAMLVLVRFGGTGGWYAAGMLLVVLAIIAVVSEAAPRLERHRARRAPKEAYIAQNGIIYEGSAYPFLSFIVKMQAVRYDEGTGSGPPSLVFSFLQLILIIVRPFDVTIPVPCGQEERAREIVHALGGSSG
jgi:hypothetical protein